MATSFSLKKLRSIIANRGGLATTEKFEVVFSGNIIANLGNSVAKDLEFLCENVALPTKSISAQEKFIHGVAYQMPYRQAFQEYVDKCNKEVYEQEELLNKFGKLFNQSQKEN